MVLKNITEKFIKGDVKVLLDIRYNEKERKNILKDLKTVFATKKEYVIAIESNLQRELEAFDGEEDTPHHRDFKKRLKWKLDIMIGIWN